MKNTKAINYKNPLDLLTHIAGPLIPLATVPQAYAVLIEKQTEGVSLVTWTFYFLSSALFAVFGIKHRQKLLIITYVPFVIIEGLIVLGLLIHK